MQFSIYSELQTWPGKTQKQVYDEALEQVVNADRLNYDAYAIIEHFFFPKFGASPNPFAFFAKCAERARHIKFHTLLALAQRLVRPLMVELTAKGVEAALLVGSASRRRRLDQPHHQDVPRLIARTTPSSTPRLEDNRPQTATSDP
jgi:hypothetical protein